MSKIGVSIQKNNLTFKWLWKSTWRSRWFYSYCKTRAPSMRFSNYHHRLLRRVEMAKTLAPENREIPGSISVWDVIFCNKFFIIFGGKKGLRCLLASLLLNDLQRRFRCFRSLSSCSHFSFFLINHLCADGNKALWYILIILVAFKLFVKMCKMLNSCFEKQTWIFTGCLTVHWSLMVWVDQVW